MTNLVVTGEGGINVFVGQEDEAKGYFSETQILDTSGVISIDWSVSRHYLLNQLTGNVGLSFIPPEAPCELTIRIPAVTSPVVFTWVNQVKWLGSVWTQEANKEALIRLYFDGTNYLTTGASEV